jgi:hypothetical protein
MTTMDLSVVGALEQQHRDALVAYYLGQLVPQSETGYRVFNENDLYEYLLIDNQVTAQVETSRVAQGIASVQQHIHAIYNGMEPGFGGVDQDELALWRDGLSQYSVWAGYQMLADYPENYLNPALRLDKTAMFKDLESTLAQSRLSRDTVQLALGNYLQAFETVSNLLIVGCYVDSANFMDADYYFIGRQSIEPFAFYWRKSRLFKGLSPEKAQMAAWTEWKPVESVSGAHVKYCRPVVMNGRLYVVWVESGKAELNAEGEKTGRFEYTLKLAYRRLDDSWSVPILLHTGLANDEALTSDVGEDGVVRKGYRLAATTDHGHNDRSRLLVAFRSTGFTTLGSTDPHDAGGARADTNISDVMAFDEFLQPLTLEDSDAGHAALAFMLGTDNRRVQFRCDQLDGNWKVTAKPNPAEPPTYPGSAEWALNQHYVLEANWQNGKLALQGFCNKAVTEKKNSEFQYQRSIQYSNYYGFTATAMAREGELRFTVVKFVIKGGNFRPVYVKLSHGDTDLGVLEAEDFISNGVTGDYEYFIATKLLSSVNPDELAISGASGGFKVFISDGQTWDLSGGQSYYRPNYQTAVMLSGIAHHLKAWLVKDVSVSLNGAAKSPVVYHDWPAAETGPRDYQWGQYASPLNNTRFGTDGFTVTREPVSAPVPLVSITAAGAQYLDLSGIGIDADASMIRLNTLFAKEFTRKASLSLESALSWETQHTEEALLPGQTAPVYVDFAGANGLYFWELFFHTPHLVATRLQQAFDYSGAQGWLEMLFNPQMRVAPLYPPPSDTDWLPYWTCRPLGLPDNPAIELEGLTDPDAIARGAPVHYRKAIFMLYLNNLIAWGDMLYRQVTRDTLNEAKLLYVRALSLLGPLSKGRSISRWTPVTVGDAFQQGQASLTALERSMADTLEDLLPVRGCDTPWLRLLDLSVFRLPVNSQLLDLWDRLDLRLHNLRHNLTLDGKPMQLALYEAPANPLDLLRAQLNASGVSQRRLGSLAVIPHYRFRAMLPRALSAVETLIRFGEQVLSHMEMRDRAEQEEVQQGHVLDDLAGFAEQLQQFAIDEADKGREVLKASRKSVEARKTYYETLIRKDVSALEKTAHSERVAAMSSMTSAHALGAAGHLANMAPNLFGGAMGGMVWGGAGFAAAEIAEGVATVLYEQAQQQLTSDMQNRRREEWQHLARQAAMEIEALDGQIEAQEVALASATTSLKQASKAREQAQALYAFIKGRPTGAGLYQWLLSQMSTLYFQAYDAVLSLCLSTEACWQYEIGDRDTRFISTTAWADNRFGLTAGETLRLGLLQMESAFLSRHERRLELTKTVSLKTLLEHYEPTDTLSTDAQQTGWAAVVETLRSQGEISFQLNASTFDKDYPGHYLRQLVRVSVSLPVVLPPYQDIRAILSQQSSRYLLKPQIGNVKYLYQQAGELPDGNDDDLRQDQIVANPRANQQIGISTGVDDHGVFTLDFGDERYLPFEGTGAISHWTLRFPNHESDEQQAVFDTLTDVILHIRYLAVDGGKAFAAEVEALVSELEEAQGTSASLVGAARTD